MLGIFSQEGANDAGCIPYSDISDKASLLFMLFLAEYSDCTCAVYTDSLQIHYKSSVIARRVFFPTKQSPHSWEIASPLRDSQHLHQAQVPV
jgi:hypothetical protein